MDQNETVTLAVVVASVNSLQKTFDEDRKERREDFKALREEIRLSHEDKVTRPEWLQRNGYVDGKVDELGRDIHNVKSDLKSDVAEIRAELAAKRAPWYAVAGGVTGIGALALTVIMALTQTGA